MKQEGTECKGAEAVREHPRCRHCAGLPRAQPRPVPCQSPEYPLSTSEETEAQRGEATCLESHSEEGQRWNRMTSRV